MDHPTLAPALQRLEGRVDWEKRRRGAMRVDLAPARDLCARLGDPQRACRVVHVAGTKGKGSVAAAVAAGLRAAGERVGLYTSPHVEVLHERVRIEGAPIEDAPLALALTRALDARDAAEAEDTPGRDATWFDLVTVAAFDAFRAAGCSFAVIEVGLGGRLDSTNVVEPEVTVITNIDLEHTQILGQTRAAIAAEKAGIVKPGVPLVHGVAAVPEDDPRAVVEQHAARHAASSTFVPPGASIDADNLALARAALAVLDLDLSEAAFAGSRLPGRAERRTLGGVPVVLDGAHVASSLGRLLEGLGADPSLVGAPQIVLAVAQDKDAPALLKAARAVSDRVFSTSVDSGIHLPAEALGELARQAGLEAVVEADPERAVVRASDRAAAGGGWVLVTGSLYLVGAVRASLDPAP